MEIGKHLPVEKNEDGNSDLLWCAGASRLPELYGREPFGRSFRSEAAFPNGM